MGVICHNSFVSGWWSESVSRVNTDREPGPASTKICSGEASTASELTREMIEKTREVNWALWHPLLSGSTVKNMGKLEGKGEERWGWTGWKKGGQMCSRRKRGRHGQEQKGWIRHIRPKRKIRCKTLKDIGGAFKKTFVLLSNIRLLSMIFFTIVPVGCFCPDMIFFHKPKPPTKKSQSIFRNDDAKEEANNKNSLRTKIQQKWFNAKFQ